jgi:hypothetical protein
MSVREALNLLVIVICSLVIFIPWSMHIKVSGISLMAWLLLSFYFLTPIVSLLFIYSEKDRKDGAQ